MRTASDIAENGLNEIEDFEVLNQISPQSFEVLGPPIRWDISAEDSKLRTKVKLSGKVFKALVSYKEDQDDHKLLRPFFIIRDLEVPLSSQRKWTLEACIDDAKKYQQRSEWSLKSRAYESARVNGWLEECCGHMESWKWTLEACIADALKYSSRHKWRLSSGGAYGAARTNGWIDECCRHMKRPTNGAPRLIYWFVDHTQKYFYVGLTGEPKIRYRNHLNTKPELRKSLAEETLEYYESSEFYENRTAQLMEAEKIDYWTSLGYRPLNKTKAGALGGNFRQWDEMACVADAKSYITRGEWARCSPGAYEAARQNGWFDQCCEHMPLRNKKWTLEACIKNAKQFSSITEWNKNSGAYRVAKENNWLDQCCLHMTPAELVSVVPDPTLSECILDAQKYSTNSKWRSQSWAIYKFAKQNEWVLECTEHMKIRREAWTFETCLDEAKKYKTRSEWALGSPAAYKFAGTQDWFEECCSHMEITRKINGYWTLANCIEDAKKYETRSRWANSGSAYHVALKNGWIEECCGHMEIHWQKKWDFTKCLESAKKYGSRSEWNRYERGAFAAALRNNWMEECCRHMK